MGFLFYFDNSFCFKAAFSVVLLPCLQQVQKLMMMVRNKGNMSIEMFLLTAINILFVVLVLDLLYLYCLSNYLILLRLL